MAEILNAQARGLRSTNLAWAWAVQGRSLDGAWAVQARCKGGAGAALGPNSISALIAMEVEK
jgi:hypothetical protein